MCWRRGYWEGSFGRTGGWIGDGVADCYGNDSALNGGRI